MYTATKKIVFSMFIFHVSLFGDFYYSGGKKHTLIKLKDSRDNSKKSSIPFQTKYNTTVKVNKRLIVSFDDLNIQKSIEKKYNLKLVKSFTKNMYLYEVEKKSLTLKIANQIYTEKGIEFCHPDFQRKKTTREVSNDPYSFKLWHLKDDMHGNDADINVEAAWEYTKGKGVKVAVYDEGIDINHEDLRENIYSFANYNDKNSNNPYSTGDTGHGTACAGILAAKENDIGGVGVAPEVSLYAIRYSDNNTSTDIQAYLNLMNEGVSIITNSWGTYSNLDAYNAIFKMLATDGRDGKGVVIIFAAGNESRNLDDAGISDESESEYVISIAASTEDNTITEYSNFGSSIDFTAPGGSRDLSRGGMFTTDATGNKGYENGEYNYNFIGTSVSAPIVAGVCALILAVNPDLTRDEIIDILKKSAQKIGSFEYDENGHNIHWGYGKVDAGEAVKLAKNYNKPVKNYSEPIIIQQDSQLKSFARIMFMEIKEE